MIFPRRLFLTLILVGCTAGVTRFSSQSPAAASESQPELSRTGDQTAKREQTVQSIPQPFSETQQDKDGLQRLISEKNNTPDNSSPVKETAETTAPSDNTAHPPHFSKVTIPPAHEIWNLTDTECKSILNSAGVESHAPTFATPFVRTPLLLDSPIEGVVIDSKWPTESFRRVMDCRLMVTLIQLARRARERGVVKIEYYSTWRPIKSITQCAAGQKGDKCRKVYERAQNGKLPSQHSRATAIDIRWFTFENGSTVDVLNHFEMNFHEPPCDDLPITEEGRFLQEFACILHQDKAFNVMLTPNADRDHENHFHFDITPNVKWYIIR